MTASLPPTGTAELLERLSCFVPDEFINQLLPRHQGRGRRALFQPAQLYRVLLLALLTPAHSFNLLARLLGEQRAWRRFAHLPNRHRIPTSCLLHEFREQLGVRGLRRINEYLLIPLLDSSAPGTKTVAIIDATDLVAATSAYKKSTAVITVLAARLWAHARSKPVRAAGSLAIRNTHCGCG
jgi:hypothetical protein